MVRKSKTVKIIIKPSRLEKIGFSQLEPFFMWFIFFREPPMVFSPPFL